MVLEQSFDKPPAERYPSRHAIQHEHSLTVDFFDFDLDWSTVVSYTNPVGLRRGVEYTFHERNLYEEFQSHLRDQIFVKEFETKIIEMTHRTGKSTTTAYTYDNYIKVWKTKPDSGEKVVTLPTPFEKTVQHRELSLRWLQCKEKGAKSVNLLFKQPAKVANGRTTIPRRSSFGFKRSNTLVQPELLPDEIAPSELVQSLEAITIEFGDDKSK